MKLLFGSCLSVASYVKVARVRAAANAASSAADDVPLTAAVDYAARFCKGLVLCLAPTDRGHDPENRLEGALGMAGVKKGTAMRVAMATVTEAVKTATDAIREMTESMVAMSETLRRIEKLLDEQTDHLVDAEDAIEKHTDHTIATENLLHEQTDQLAETKDAIEKHAGKATSKSR